MRNKGTFLLKGFKWYNREAQHNTECQVLNR